MRSIVDEGQMLEVEVGVDLGGADIGVAEELLHGAKISARLEKV
jgi:hypothetical protein